VGLLEKGDRQALITGAAEFVKVSASLTIGGDIPPFTNILGGPMFPETGGMGIAMFTTVGATMMLIATLGIFTRGARRPVLYGNANRSARFQRTRRILSITGRRIKRSWRLYGTKK